MLKKIAKLVTIFVFLVCIAGVALFYGGQNVALVKQYSLLSIYATGGVISILSTFILARVIRIRYSTRLTTEERQASEYWKTNLQRVKQSKLASFGNPFKKYPSFLLIRNKDGKEFDRGTPVMGVEYRQDMPNILVGDSLFVIDLPLEKAHNYLGFVKSLGKANIKGILLEDGDPSMLDKDGVAGLVKYINTHTVRRNLPVYLFVPDRGDMRLLMDDGSIIARSAKMAPFGYFCDPSAASGSIDSAKQLLSQNLSILRNIDLSRFQDIAQRHSTAWKNIEDAVDRASSLFKSLSVSNGLHMRGLLYGEGVVAGRPQNGIGIQTVLLSDVGTVDNLNRPRFSLVPQSVYLLGLLGLIIWMTYSFVQGKQNLNTLSEQLILEHSVSEFNDNLSHYRNYVTRIDDLTTGLKDIFRIGDDVRLRMKEKYVSQFEGFFVKPYVEMLKISRSASNNPQVGVEQMAALFQAVKLTEGKGDIAQEDYSLLLKEMLALHTVITEDTMLQDAGFTFRRYLEWIEANDKSALNKELDELFVDLYMSASRKSNSLLALLKMNSKLKDVRIQNDVTFPADNSSIYVNGIFSYPAISALNSLVLDLRQVSENPDFHELIEKQKEDYISAYELAWKSAFIKSIKLTKTLDKSSLEPGLVYLAKNSSLFDRIVSEYAENITALTRVGERENGEFAQELLTWRRLMDPDYRKQLMSSGLLSGISDKSAIAVKKIKNIMSSGSNEEAQYKLEKSVLSLIMKREQLISELAKVSLGEDVLSFNSVLASNFEAEKSTSASMPKESMNKLLWLDQRILNLWSSQASSETGVKDLLGAESEYLIKGIMNQSGRYIQNKWQSNVLFELSSASGWNRSKMISGKDGLVWTFKKEYLEPFVKSSGNRRYVERDIAGVKLGLSESMLALLGKGSLDEQILEDELSIAISTLPTSVNRAAVELPVLTTLELNCDKGRQKIENENFPLDANFQWTPGECNDVDIRVYFGNGFVEKKYSGYAGMIAFFGDFKSGKKQFSRKSFPGSGELFSALNLKTITVRFRIKPSVSIDGLLNLYSTNVPSQIIKGSGVEIYASN